MMNNYMVNFGYISHKSIIVIELTLRNVVYIKYIDIFAQNNPEHTDCVITVKFGCMVPVLCKQIHLIWNKFYVNKIFGYVSWKNLIDTQARGYWFYIIILAIMALLIKKCQLEALY